MEMTNDEFVAVVQSYDPSLDPKFNLSSRIPQDAQNRYNTFARQNYPVNMSQQDFESLRRNHMTQLFTAYKQQYDGTASTHQKWLGSQYTTNPSDIRRILGNRAGGVDYNGPMVLDHETITAIYHLASLRGYGNRYFDHEWVDKLNYSTLSQVVDEMISTKNILLENAELEGNPYLLQTGSTIYRETGIAERAIENHVTGHYFDKTQHSETAQDFSRRKTNIFSKTAAKFKTFFEKFNDSEGYAKKQEELGNKAFTPKEDIGGR